jgi:hypothetical protein
MNYSANKMAAKHCLRAQCIVVDIVPLMLFNFFVKLAICQVQYVQLSVIKAVEKFSNSRRKLHKKQCCAQYNISKDYRKLFSCQQKVNTFITQYFL